MSYSVSLLALILLTTFFSGHAQTLSPPIPVSALAVVRKGSLTIKTVDFRNFCYRGPVDYNENFCLENGQRPFVRGQRDGIEFDSVSYQDLTGDGQDEAIVRLNIQTGGSALPSVVFIYGIEEGKPVSIWKFITGDRADGGLKSIVGENGNLIVELYGENKLVDDRWKITDDKALRASCCPANFTRSVLHWNGKQFVVYETKILSISQK